MPHQVRRLAGQGEHDLPRRLARQEPPQPVRRVTRPEALDRRVRLNQRPIDAEVLVAGQAPGEGSLDRAAKERRRQAEFIQPRPVVREGRRIKSLGG